MKKFIAVVSFVAFLSLISINAMVVTPVFAPVNQDTVHLLVSPELAGLVNKWITEYSQGNPESVINQVDIYNEGDEYDLEKNGALGIVTEDYLHSLDNKSLWSMVVARDVVVPVINSDNPFSDIINKNGISPGMFAGVYTEEGLLTWGKVLKTKDDTPVNCYCLGDEQVKFCLSQFLQADNLKGNPTIAEDNDELIGFIKNDRYSIGFCRLSGLINYEHNSIKEGLQVVPIDINGNGILEHNENIYTCLNDFNRGVWIGKYPGSLCRNIHVVSAGAPVAVSETDFLKWVLSGGQAYISEAGYSELIPGERQPKLQALNRQDVAVINAANKPVRNANILFIVATVFIVGFLVYVIVKMLSSTKKEPKGFISSNASVYDENSVKVPGGIFFDKTHTWTYMEKEGKVRIGVDDFLQHTTGKITRVDMRQIGSKIKKGEVVISLIQNGKRLNVYSPVSGLITKINNDLSINPSLINSAPYSDGWFYMIEPENWIKETRKYFMGENYLNWLKAEFSRLKDFIAVAVKSDNITYSQVVLQDGGEIREGLMENFGPDVWEEFQRKFIDTSI